MSGNSASMVRKVAHAISTEVIGELDATYLAAARAAIQAMLEPSDVMLKAACPALRNYIEGTPKEERERLWGKPRPHRGYNIPDKLKHGARYQAMIAAALSEDEGKG